MDRARAFLSTALQWRSFDSPQIALTLMSSGSAKNGSMFALLTVRVLPTTTLERISPPKIRRTGDSCTQEAFRSVTILFGSNLDVQVPCYSRRVLLTASDHFTPAVRSWRVVIVRRRRRAIGDRCRRGFFGLWGILNMFSGYFFLLSYDSCRRLAQRPFLHETHLAMRQETLQHLVAVRARRAEKADF